MLASEKVPNPNIVQQNLAIAASLPLSLYGAFIGGITLFLLIIGGPSNIENVARGPIWHNFALILGTATLLVLFFIAVITIKFFLPIWSYTWIGAGLIGALVALNLVIEDRLVIISPTADIVVLTLFFLSGLITFGIVASRGWRHSGLYSIGICATLGLSLCFFGVAGPFHYQLGALALLVGIVESILVYAYIRQSIAVSITVLIGIWATNTIMSWLIEYLFRSSNSSRQVSQFWNLAALLTIILFGGTLVGLPGRFVYSKFLNTKPIIKRIFTGKRDTCS